MPGLVRIVGVIASTIVLAVALGACGVEDSAAKNDYVKQVNAAQARFAQTVTKLAQTSSTRQHRRALNRFRTAIDDVVGTLRSIEVPDEVRAEHARLVTAMAGFGRDVSAAREAILSSRTPKVLADAQRRISGATITVNANITAAISAINAKLHAK